MRASTIIVGLFMAAMAASLPSPDMDMDQSLYHQESSLYTELVGEEAETELVEVLESTAPVPEAAPADLNADNGTPISVAAASVHEEVYRFVQYEFEVARQKCSNATAGTFEVTDTKTDVGEGIDYEVTFTMAGASHTMKVKRDPIGNPKELPGEQEVVRDEFNVVSLTPEVCAGMASWTATEYPEFTGLATEEFAAHFLGDAVPDASDFKKSDEPISEAAEAGLPNDFDWRKHMGKTASMNPKKQGECASCYAITAASVMSDRLFLASKGRINVDLSAQEISDCSNHCQGGTANDAFMAIKNHKVVPDWCEPYSGKSGTCAANTCSNATAYGVVEQGDKMVTLGIQGRDKVTAIMYQLYHYGPVYMRMEVFSDFPYYRSGVYKHQPDAKVRGDHAVKLIGWGEEGSMKYWVAQNSWGNKWGEKGFFRIARGSDESGVESRGVFWAIPDVQDVCPGKPACNNGGSFTADCGCQCAEGYTGDTCDTCSAVCEGEGFTGKLKPQSCECECAPGYYDGDVDGTETKCGLRIGGSKGVEHHAIAVPPCVDEEPQCPNWHNQGFCHEGSKYADYTNMHCMKSCGHCDTKPAAQIPVLVEGHLTYQYGDMVVAVPAGKEPWNIHSGWASPAFYSFVCGPESSFEESLYCEDRNAVNVKIAKQGAYDLYQYDFLGKNLLGQSKGWTATPRKLAVGACAGDAEQCIFPTPSVEKKHELDDMQKAEVKQRLADSALSDAQKAQKELEDEKKKFLAMENAAHKKLVEAQKKADQAEKKKEAAEAKAKAEFRKHELEKLKALTEAKEAKAKARAKEVDFKRNAEKKKSAVADHKRHNVVDAITVHKKDLDELGKISAELADEQAHLDATADLASKERTRKVTEAQAQEKVKVAKGEQQAMMRKAEQLAKEAALAQKAVTKKTLALKESQQHRVKATNDRNEADKAFKIHEEYVKKHAATDIKHTKWQQMAIMAEHNVTKAKEIAVSAMETAQCIIKDHRGGCKSDKWKKHCQNTKWKAWMMTHCTESCGFSCEDLHTLAIAVVTKAEDQMRKKEAKARKAACPKYNDLAKHNAEESDKYGRWSTQYIQGCTMRHNKKDCALRKKYAKMAKTFEAQHDKFKAEMEKLDCYLYHGTWSKGPGPANGTAAGEKLLRLESPVHSKVTKPTL